MRILAPASALCLAVLAWLAIAGPAAAAATEAQLSAIKSNCRSDYMSNCWGVPKGAQAFQCLKEHMAKLSSGCQQAVKAAIPAPAPAPTPVAAEPAPATQPPAPAAAAEPAATEAPPAAVEAKAPSAPAPESASPPPPKAAAVTPAKPAPAKQAKTEAPVSTSPAAATPEETPPVIGFLPPRKKLMVLKNCHEDLETYCADVPFGEGRNLRCLFGHKAELTPDCQGALAQLTQ